MTERQIYNQLKKEFGNCPDSLIKEAKKWYPETKKYIEEKCDEFGITYLQGSALFSSLSPLKSVPENKKLFEAFLKGKRRGHFSNQVRKAKRILNLSDGTPKDYDKILSGSKTISFFRHLYTPQDNKYVVVDTHMLRLSFKGIVPRMTDYRYRVIAGCVKKLAKEANMKTSEMQSSLWLQAKNLYGNNI